ncbi:MAG: UDP-N-acetylglucosamine 2-epimerase (hydrolyzing) [Rickettsiales bacterium]|nr:UDP-N-acetylglucosamine 2-epimerase (hydrolyzing) [Rickettsiales bacterium]
MIKKKNICVVLTARPSYSRIKTALEKLKQNSKIKLSIIVSGSLLLSKYGNAAKVIENDGFEITDKIYSIMEGENLVSTTKTTAIQLMELVTLFEKNKPDCVVTVADRFETLSTAVASAYMNIPLIHIQGGEVTGSIDEKVRHAVTKLSDLHLVCTSEARNRVIKMGEHENSVIVTGCPSIDLAKIAIKKKPNIDNKIWNSYNFVGKKFDVTSDYLVLMQHPVTTHYKMNHLYMTNLLSAVKSLDINTFCFWPNPDAGSDGISNAVRTFREKQKSNKFAFFKNFEPDDFIRLLNGSKCLVGNSSAGIRECSFLGLPVVNIGERQQHRQRASNVLDCSNKATEILTSLKKQINEKKFKRSEIYGKGFASEKINKAIENWNLKIKKSITY